jgi:hypothetical protein
MVIAEIFFYKQANINKQIPHYVRNDSGGVGSIYLYKNLCVTKFRHCELENNPESVDLSIFLDCSQAHNDGRGGFFQSPYIRINLYVTKFRHC